MEYPIDIWIHIILEVIKYQPLRTIFNIMTVCKFFNEISHYQLIWKEIHHNDMMNFSKNNSWYDNVKIHTQEHIYDIIFMDNRSAWNNIKVYMDAKHNHQVVTKLYNISTHSLQDYVCYTNYNLYDTHSERKKYLNYVDQT
jgi:hypothetical protein